MSVRILIVDDEQEYLNLTKRRLDAHFDVDKIDTVLNAEAAVEKLDAGETYHVIVIDMRLEGNSRGGFDFVQEVRSREQNSALIIFTANETWEDCREALRYFHCWDYISKTMPERSAVQELIKSIEDAITQGIRGAADH